MLKRLVPAITVFAVLAMGAAGEVALPSAKNLLAEIQTNGPKPVLHRIWADQAQFDAICAAIESASPDWLEVARRLKSASDAAASLSLNYSVARALPVAPASVLALVGTEFSLRDVCTSPFIEPLPGIAENYEQRTLAALAKLSDPSLKDRAAQCAALVRLPER